jgi:hypothetical protein
VGTGNLLRWLRAAFQQPHGLATTLSPGVDNGRRLTFAAGEAKLSAWMADNAYVTWIETDRP